MNPTLHTAANGHRVLEFNELSDSGWLVRESLSQVTAPDRKQPPPRNALEKSGSSVLEREAHRVLFPSLQTAVRL